MSRNGNTGSRIILFLALLSVGYAIGTHGAELPAPLLGSWRLGGGSEVLLIEEHRLVSSSQGQLRVFGLLEYEDGRITVRRAGLVERWGARVADGMLILEQSGEPRSYQRIASIPEEVRLDPFPFGPSDPLPAGRVSAIQHELAQRLQADQEAIKSGRPEEEVNAVIRGSRGG